MKTIDKIILHIPLIGLIYMFILFSNQFENYPIPTYNETKIPGMIQVATVTILLFVLLFTTY